VHAYIVGEHGDSQIPVRSSARIAGVAREEFLSNWGCPTRRTRWEKSPVTRTAGIEISGAKGAAYYGIGAALVPVERASLRDEDAVLTVSSLMPEESTQLGKVSLSLPPIISRNGGARVLAIPLNSSERKSLESSVAMLEQYIAGVGAEVTAV
jgi:L-lactate dehydrogenase